MSEVIKEWYKKESPNEWYYREFIEDIPCTFSEDIKKLSEDDLKEKYHLAEKVITYFDKKIDYCYFAYEQSNPILIFLIVSAIVLFLVHWVAGTIGVAFIYIFIISDQRRVSLIKYHESQIIKKSEKVMDMLSDEIKQRARKNTNSFTKQLFKT